MLMAVLLPGYAVADMQRIQVELADRSEVVPPLIQAIGKEAFVEAMATGKYRYSGNAKCRLCHRDFFVGRKEDVHDHAYEKLVKSSPQHIENGRCLNCHATGYGVEGGFQSMQKTPRLANVQCEGCHGPGEEHIRIQVTNMPVIGGFGSQPKPNRATGAILGGFLAGADNPKRLKKMCQACHTKRWNQSFHDLDKAYDGYRGAKPTMESNK